MSRFMNKAQVDDYFIENILPCIKDLEYKYGFAKDSIMRCEEYNNMTDSLCKDGHITEAQYNRYCIPKRYT